MRHRVKFCCFMIHFLLMTHEVFAGDSISQSSQKLQSALEFSSFSSARTEILSLVGAATKRVWIVTDFFSDADIVSSIYIAKYRKVQVQVLLGKEMATSTMSRLGYLKQVGIQVAIRPKKFYAGFPTIILADDKLYSFNANLDNQTKNSKLKLSQLSLDDVSGFEVAFSNAANDSYTLNVRPLPQVGHARSGNSAYRGGGRYNSPIQTTGPGAYAPANGVTLDPTTKLQDGTSTRPHSSGVSSAEGSYRYNSVREAPSKGVATKLPRSTIVQERERERAREKVDSRSQSVNRIDPATSNSP